VQGAWDVIEKVVGEGAKLRPRATTPALDALAARIQVTLPADLRESLSVHDGQEPEGDGFLPRMHSDVLLLSADEIAIRWAEQKALYEQAADDDAYTELIEEVDDTGRVRQISFHPGRILIAEGESTRGMVWLDFVPGPRGTTGQVVTCVDVDVEFAAENLPAYLTAVAAQLTELNGVVSELTAAAMNGDIARVRRLLDAGMPVDAINGEETALALAAREGQIGTVSLLLDRGADPNRKTGYGQTPIEYAAQFGNTDVVRLLLDRGTRLRTRDGMTLLHHACDSQR
jgi:cell wall assembly regulator SMI1